MSRDSSSSDVKLQTGTPQGQNHNLGVDSFPAQTAHIVEEIRGSRDGEPTNLIAALVAAWLLTSYLLPHTIWGNASPMGTVAARTQMLTGQVPLFGSILLGLFAVCVLSTYRTEFYSRPFSPSALWLLIGVYACVLILPGMLHRTEEASAATGILLPLLAGILAARLCSNSISAIRLLVVLISLQAIYSLWYMRMGIILNGRPGSDHPSGTFDNADILISTLIVALPIAIVETVRSSKTSARTAWGLCITVMLAALASTGSRVGLLAVVCAICFIVLRAASHWKLQLVFGLAIAALAICFVHRPTPSSPILTFQSIIVRSVAWKQGLERAMTKIGSGTGIGAFDQIKPVSTVRATCLPPLTPIHEPGNMLIHWLEELGIAGGILYCLLIAAIVNALRRKDQSTETIIGAAWIALLVFSLFDTPFGSFSRSSGTAMVGVLLGATMLPASRASREAVDGQEAMLPRRVGFVPQYIIPGAMFGIAICLSWSTLHSLHNNRQHTAQIVDVRASEILAGRSGYLGSVTSPYTLIEFADYECPPCRANRSNVHDVLERYKGKLKLDFRNLPLPSLHPNAMYAAIVAEAARTQGKFWDTNSILFDLKLTEPAIQKVVKDQLQSHTLPPDLLRTARNAVEADIALAGQLGIEGTPSFLLCCPDGRVYRLQTPENVSEIL